jgi:hypothetical protein
MEQATRAYCAQHRQSPALINCRRCGNFMCAVCSEDGREKTCPACRALNSDVGTFPYDRERGTFSDVFSYVYQALQRDWVMLAVGVLLLLAVLFGVTLVGQVVLAGALAAVMALVPGVRDPGDDISFAGMGAAFASIIGFYFIFYVVQGVLQMGLARMTLDVLYGRKADVARLFSQWRKAGRFLIYMLLMLAIIAVPLALVFGGQLAVFLAGDQQARDPSRLIVSIVAEVIGLIAFIWLVIPLYLVPIELALSDVSAVQAIKNCFAAAKGRRLGIIGYTLLGGLSVLIGFVLCCLPVFPAVAFAQMLLGAALLKYRTGADVETSQER